MEQIKKVYPNKQSMIDGMEKMISSYYKQIEELEGKIKFLKVVKKAGNTLTPIDKEVEAYNNSIKSYKTMIKELKTRLTKLKSPDFKDWGKE